MFTLDHTHYARWLSVFIEDLNHLHPSLREAFMDGKFVVRKTDRQFSCIGVDQAHEQNNKLIKIKRGAIGILDNENAMLRWAVVGPILIDLCKEKEATVASHHEDTDDYERRFRKDVLSLVNVFDEYGNPFKEKIKDRLLQVVSKTLMDEESSRVVKTALETGTQQYQKFVNERLHQKKASLYAIISRNKFKIFHDRILSVSKDKSTINSLKADRRLFSRLYIACQSRKGDLDNFFSYENHSYLVSISEYGRLRKCNAKSDFLTCLSQYQQPCDESSMADMIVFDGAAFVNANPLKTSSTFIDYCTRLSEKVLLICRGAKRIDVCFDIYKDDSLKLQTRENRGAGIRTVVRENTPTPKDFKSFMRNNSNKTELFGMFATTLAGFQGNTQVVASLNNHVLTNTESFNASQVSHCNHEEADTRVILHAFDGAKGMKKIKIVTVDTDVVVIALYHFFSLSIEEFWIEFGVGKNRKFYPIPQYAEYIEEEICRGLPFWFCFTGCDTVSMFSHRGKITAWQVWNVLPEVTRVFVG